ncbi:hypothetical protein ACFPRL_18830 [Pseudoclavibacter helvolus]
MHDSSCVRERGATCTRAADGGARRPRTARRRASAGRAAGRGGRWDPRARCGSGHGRQGAAGR